MIKIIKKSDEKLEFVTDMTVSMVNAIRRSVNEIPLLAVDSLEISKNDSALYDEVIAHRMGFVPIKNEELKLPEECSCKGKGCGKCTVKFKLKAEGPCVVYSTDVSPKTDIVYKMPVTILDKGQCLEFVAIAKVGKGIQHAKFTPGLFYYRYADDIDRGDLKADDENFGKIIEAVQKEDEREIAVFIESWGQIKAKEIFTKSVNALLENLKEFSKAINKQ